MKVQIKSCFEGAKEAEGTVIIIDAFRASSTINEILYREAESVIPVQEIKKAISLKKENSEYLLFGDKEGEIPVGFDYGNSPVEISDPDLILRDKIAVLRTSACTQAINYAKNAKKIYIGSFTNAEAVCDYIKKESPELVTLVPVGSGLVYQEAPDQMALEDELCAQYMKELLEGREPDFRHIRKRLMSCKGANRLRKLGQNDDLEFCLTTDFYDIVPYVDKIGKLSIIKL